MRNRNINWFGLTGILATELEQAAGMWRPMRTHIQLASMQCMQL